MSDDRDTQQQVETMAVDAPDAPPVEGSAEAFEDQLLDLYLREEHDERPRQYAIIVTCAIFIVLFLVSLPKGRSPEFEDPVYYVPDLETYVPPMKEQPKIERRELEDVKKVPLPDPTPDEPEPIIEPTPEPEPPPIPQNARVMRGLPRAPPSRGGPVREGMAGLKSPVVINDVQPEYPTIARRAGVSGTVVIRAIIDKQGNVKSAQLLKGLGQFGLDEAAIEAVKKRTYEPGVLEGKPVEVEMTIRVNYLLQR